MNENSDYKTKEIPEPIIKERDDSEIDPNVLVTYMLSDIESLKEIEKDLKHRKKDLETQLKQRKISFDWVLWLISVYLVFVAFFLGFIFWEFTKTHHTFSPTIVMTLLGTTTATVLGLPYIVLKNLFPHSNKK
jgi:hypothetical protein